MNCLETQGAVSLRKNLANNMPFLISSAANVVLCVSKTIQVDIFLLLVSFAILLLCIFHPGLCPKRQPSAAGNAALVCAILSELVFLICFCNTFRFGRLTDSINAFGLPADAVFFVGGCLLCMLGAYSSYLSVRWLFAKLQPFQLLCRSMYKQYAIVALIYCIGITAIVRANYYYVDDMGRTLFGYQLTGDFSRHLATFASTILNGNTWLTDISPLTQYQAACIMAFAAIVLLFVLTGKTQCTVWTVAAVIPFGLSPYFLECYSYKFDAPYMALSVLMAVAPLLYRDRPPVKYGIAAAAGTLMVCLTYQASSGIFPLLVVLMAFQMWTQRENAKQILTFIFTSAAGYIVGMLVFVLVLMTPVSNGNYVSSTISLQSIFVNIRQYLRLIIGQYHGFWLFLICLILVSFLFQSLQGSWQRKLPTLAAAVLTLVLTFVLSFGVYVALSDPLFDPRAMYGFGIFIASLCILITFNAKAYLPKAAILGLSWVFFVFSFTYGNALSLQQEYTDFRIEQVLTDLNDLEMLADQDSVTIQVQGTIGHAKAIDNMAEEYGILEEMVTVQFRDSAWSWGDYMLLYYYGADSLSRDRSIDLTEYDLPILTDTMYHTIYGNENYILIQLK